jgi:hypothetical protein
LIKTLKNNILDFAVTAMDVTYGLFRKDQRPFYQHASTDAPQIHSIFLHIYVLYTISVITYLEHIIQDVEVPGMWDNSN